MTAKRSSYLVLSSSLKLILSSLIFVSITNYAASEESNENNAKEDESDVEEIIVTARKRPEPINKVPISISAVNGDQLQEMNINDLETVSYLFPQVNISEAGASTNLFIRGVGSGVNQGFEQSVGLFIDDVYYGRHYMARAPFFDLAQVEVLKTPQTTLFGKNTIAGAVNLTTEPASFSEEGYANVKYTPEFGESEINGAFNQPINENLAIRVAAKYNQFEGYLENPFRDQSETQSDTSILRISAAYDVNADLSIKTKFEHNAFDRTGRRAQISNPGTYLALFQSFEPEETGKVDDIRVAGGTGRFNDEFFKLSSNVFTLKAEYELTEGELVSITALTQYSVNDMNDPDGGAGSIAITEIDQSHQQISQEFRYLSPNNDEFNYLFGLYFQQANLEQDDIIDVDLNPLAVPISLTRFSEFDQSSSSLSVYGHFSSLLTEKLTLSGGLRYSMEQKSVTKEQILAALFERTPDPVAEAGGLVALGWNPHSFDKDRNENQIMPSATLSYDADPTLIFATIATGEKAGGFDAFSANGDPDAFEFENEKVVASELGFKFPTREGADRHTLTFFYNQYTDLQVSTFDGAANFLVGNAGESVAQGIELESRFNFESGLQLGTAVNYLDSFYSKFEDAQCTDYQVQATSGSCTQDLKNKETQFSPDWGAQLDIFYSSEVLGTYIVNYALVGTYRSKYALANDLDINMFQEAHSKWDARVSLAKSNQNWSLALVGSNLTDEKITNWGNDIPLFPGAYFRHLDKPRSFTLHFQYKF